MTEAAQRAAVVAEAQTWIRTPYRHHARLKGVGVDCAQFPAAVYEACGLVPHLAPRYSAQWHLHHDVEAYLAWVRPHAREITADEIQPGDFGIWRFGRAYSHGAIIVRPPEVIHAVLREGGVVLGNMSRDIDLVGRPVKFFSLWGR